MATYSITAPNGKTYTIQGPEGASRDEVKARIMQSPVYRMDMQRESVAMGMGDLIHGGAQLLANSLPGGVVDAVNSATQWVNEQPVIGPVTQALGMVPATPEQLNQNIAEREQQYQAMRGPDAGFDWNRLMGGAVATLPAAWLGTSLRGATAVGAGIGATQPQTGGEFSWQDKAIQTGAGGAGGALGYGAGQLASRLIAPQVSNAVSNLMSRGVRPTAGQTLGGMANTIEQKMASVPFAGDFISSARRRAVEDFNRAVYSDILEPIGGRVPQVVGRDAVADVGDQISRAYEDVLPYLNFGTDQQFGNDFTQLTADVLTLPQEQQTSFWSFVRDKLVPALQPGNGRMTGEAFKVLESDLSRLAARFSGSQQAHDQILGDAFTDLLTAMRGGLARTNQGVQVNVNGSMIDAGQRLRDLNLAWAKLVRLERASGGLGATEGVFSPAQMLNAVRAGDASVRDRQFARGGALMQGLAEDAKTVLGNTVPDSGTPGRMAAMLAGTAGLGGVVSPWAAAPAAAMVLPYTQTGQRFTSALLTQRPAIAPAMAQMLRDAFPLLVATGAQAPGMVSQ